VVTRPLVHDHYRLFTRSNNFIAKVFHASSPLMLRMTGRENDQSLCKCKVKVHKNIKTDPDVFFDLIFPYLDDIAVCVECVFCPEKSSGSSTGTGWLICAPNTTSALSLAVHYT
jgi:hypothetical protein